MIIYVARKFLPKDGDDFCYFAPVCAQTCRIMSGKQKGSHCPVQAVEDRDQEMKKRVLTFFAEKLLSCAEDNHGVVTKDMIMAVLKERCQDEEV